MIGKSFLYISFYTFIYLTAIFGIEAYHHIETNGAGLLGEIETVHLHLDNDTAGRSASASIIEALRGRCAVVDEPPLRGKDVNDYLKLKLGIRTETDKVYER
jgi:hypothetical protein